MGILFRTLFDIAKIAFKVVFAMVGFVLCLVLGSTPN